MSQSQVSLLQAQHLRTTVTTPPPNHGPPPAYAHGREAVGGAEAWPQVHPGVVRARARAAEACEWRAAGWRVPAEPTMLRLNSQVLGFRIRD